MSDRPFRFAVSHPPLTSAPEVAELARRIEAMGFDLVYMADHLGAPAPFPVLATVAAATTDLRIGTLVNNNDFWNPVLLAREAATLAVLSGGRFELGLGAGHARVEYEAVGLSYDRPWVRVDRLAETVGIVRRLLDGETVSASGAHYDLVDAAVGFDLPGPVPVLVGGNGDRVLGLAAREADIVGLTGFRSGTGKVHTDLSHFRWEGLADRIDHVRSSAGARFGDLELQVLVQKVAVGDRQGLAAQTAAEFEVPIDVVADSPFVMLGSVDEMVAHCERLRSAGVTALAAFSRAGAVDLEPVIARVG